MCRHLRVENQNTLDRTSYLQVRDFRQCACYLSRHMTTPSKNEAQADRRLCCVHARHVTRRCTRPKGSLSTERTREIWRRTPSSSLKPTLWWSTRSRSWTWWLFQVRLRSLHNFTPNEVDLSHISASFKDPRPVPNI